MTKEYTILDKNHEEQITSIQRISDNSIFNLGDSITNKNSGGSIYTIKGIYVSDNDIPFFNIGGENTILLKNSILTQKVLFVADYNCPVVEGDTYYVLT